MHHSVCACLCVLAEAVATSLLALWLQQWRLFLNVGRALCLRQAATGTAAHLSCQHSLCLPGIYLAALFGCVRVCVHWIEREWCIFFPFILGRREANDTQHTPHALKQQWPDMYLHTNVMGWGSLWRYRQLAKNWRLWEMQLVCNHSVQAGEKGSWVLL